MTITRYRVNVTTDGSGDFSQKIQSPNGIFMQVRYIPDPSTPLDTDADLTMVEDDTGLNLLNFDSIGTSAITRAPRHVTALASTGAEGAVTDYIAVAGDVTLTIENGGNTLSGIFYAYFNR